MYERIHDKDRVVPCESSRIESSQANKCVILGESLIHDDYLLKYSDYELVEHLDCSEVSLTNAKEKGVFDREEVWRKKLNGLVSKDDGGSVEEEVH
ncbi:unnamed protein product [Arabis nemorensis]|uniref:Uncharacterized protein n=1 Tax=Arabis nemorensis TaxID=586526 RepID=A0A565C4Y2_9BRAS|nr:unnamed protein product [Arabis nemorensis]